MVALNGGVIAGPAVSWMGRRHGWRQQRRWARAWSPEQIALRLPIDFPDDMTMRISHEAIYQALFIQGRGALRRELTACTSSSLPIGPANRQLGHEEAPTFLSPPENSYTAPVIPRYSEPYA